MIEVLWQDPWLIAVNKPAGWLVHRSWLAGGETQFIMQTVRDQTGQHVFTVHRLDRPTSGVLLMGLSRETGRLLSEQFAARQVEKTYHAVVRGWLQGAGRIDYPLVQEQDKIADRFSQGEKPARQAITDWRTLAQAEIPVAVGRYSTARYSLVELQPYTGRKHQLRRHMAHLRHPIIGDGKHGDLKQNRAAAEHTGMHRLMLHASELRLRHPVTAEPLIIKAGFDLCWQQSMAALGWQHFLHK